jgi:hypothetical protein
MCLAKLRLGLRGNNPSNEFFRSLIFLTGDEKFILPPGLDLFARGGTVECLEHLGDERDTRECDLVQPEANTCESAGRSLNLGIVHLGHHARTICV